MSPEHRQAVLNYISHLSESQFYGNLVLRFDKGRIVLLNVQQALKPENLPQLISQEESKPRSSYGTITS
jgi:hypothetical protein